MIEDNQILALYKQGETQQAFNHLVRKYSDRLYWHIRELCGSHDDANDLLQITFIKAWQGIDEFRNDSKIYTWLYRIATNQALTFLRRKKLIAFISLSNYDAYLENKIEQEPYFNGDKLQVLLHKAIISLPDKQRAVFSLRYFQNMKYEEMSEIMGTSVGALKASYHHAYEKVKKAIEREWEE